MVEGARSGQSIMQRLAHLSEAERKAIIGDLEPEALLHEWRLWARPEQLPPPGDWNVWAYIAGRGSGKALAVDTPIPTPGGWTTMGELQPGDLVYDEEGHPCLVAKAHEPYVPDVAYRLTFSDGSSLDACADHQWVTWSAAERLERLRDGAPIPFTVSGLLKHRQPGPSVVNTRHIADTLFTDTGVPNHCVPPVLEWHIPTRLITAAERVEPTLMRCITVTSPNSMYLAGESKIPTHNTRAGAEWVIDKVKNHGARRIALVGRASADVRDIQVQGVSGILACSPPSFMPQYEPSKRRIIWPNGAIAQLFSAEEPDQLRGVQFDTGWSDEVGSWKYVPDSAGTTAWDNLRMGLRLGDHPQLLVTSTPRRLPIIRELLDPKTPDVVVTHSTTWDNAANLPDSFMQSLRAMYQGSALERQELMGLLVEDIEGALWNATVIETNRHQQLFEALPYRIVGVDPSVAERPGDECGIVVVGATGEPQMWHRRAYVLDDLSVQGSPDVWGKAVARAARKWGAPVVAETNQGGALVRMTLQTIDPSITVYEVTAREGKQLRAEPLVAATNQGRVKFLGYHPDLEDQMVSWVPGSTRQSPDRIDAFVHAASALLIKPPKGFLNGGGTELTAKSLAGHRLPSLRPSTRPSARGGPAMRR